MLEVENLNYSVDGTRILSDVSLEVHTGELVGVLGPNGSGKSTLLKNIYKMLRPQSGRILLQGKDMLSMSNREMAECLNLSRWTIDSHIRHIYDKLAVNSRTQAVRRAREHGLLP